MLTASFAARRRADALGRPPDAVARPPDVLVRHLASLALPVDRPGELARLVPAGLVVIVGAASLAFGSVGAVGAVIALVLCDVVLRKTAPRRRAAATARALPLVLDGVARHLRAGGSLSQAIVATEPPPSAPDLRASWARLADLVPMVGVTAALDDWCTTSSFAATHDPAVRLASAALSLAATTGGSPARAIDGVAATLRSKLAVAEEIRALSSQSRASAAVIAVAPLAFGVLAGAGDPRTREFLGSPTGLVLLAAGIALDAVGAWWMARLCRPALGSA